MTSSQLLSMRGRMTHIQEIPTISLKFYQHENRRLNVLSLSVQAPVSDDRLAALSEVDILPIRSRLLSLLVAPNHVCIARYLALCLALVRDHIPGDYKEEKCPHCLKETAGEQAVLQGTKLPVIFLWGELVCEDPVHHCRLSQSDCTPVRVKNGAGGNEWLEGVG